MYEPRLPALSYWLPPPCLWPFFCSVLLSLTCSVSVLALPTLTLCLIASLSSQASQPSLHSLPIPSPWKAFRTAYAALHYCLCLLMQVSSGLKGECVDCTMKHFHSSRSQSEADSQTNDKKKKKNQNFADIDETSQICKYEMIKTLNTH